MRRAVGFVWATALRGLVAIVPFGILAYMVASLAPAVIAAAGVLDGVLPFGHLANLTIALAAALGAVLLLCFAVGSALGTRPGDALKRWVDGLLEGAVPLYGAARKLAERVTGTRGEEFSSVEVDLYGSPARVFGLFVESLPEDRCAVFVPFAPAAAVGQVYVVPRSSVNFLDAPMQEAMGTVTEWGVGSSKLYRSAAER